MLQFADELVIGLFSICASMLTYELTCLLSLLSTIDNLFISMPSIAILLRESLNRPANLSKYSTGTDEIYTGRSQRVARVSSSKVMSVLF